MKTKIVIQISTIIISIVALVAAIMAYQQAPNLAFIRSGRIVEKYSGMNEARNLIEQKVKEYQYQLDTLTYMYQQRMTEFNQNRDNYNDGEIEIQKQQITALGEKLEELSQKVEEKATMESDKITQGVLNQINSYVKKYAEDNNIDMVFGVTVSGNVMYGADAIDITDIILKGLNENYK